MARTKAAAQRRQIRQDPETVEAPDEEAAGRADSETVESPGDEAAGPTEKDAKEEAREDEAGETKTRESCEADVEMAVAKESQEESPKASMEILQEQEQAPAQEGAVSRGGVAPRKRPASAGQTPPRARAKGGRQITRV